MKWHPLKNSLYLDSIQKLLAALNTGALIFLGYLSRPEEQNLSPIELQTYEEERGRQKTVEGLNRLPQLHQQSRSCESCHVDKKKINHRKHQHLEGNPKGKHWCKYEVILKEGSEY